MIIGEKRGDQGSCSSIVIGFSSVELNVFIVNAVLNSLSYNVNDIVDKKEEGEGEKRYEVWLG